MPAFIDLTGKRYGRLTVVSRAEKNKFRAWQWNCVCDCGGTTITPTGSLRSGHTASCGCLVGENSVTHGASRTPEYLAYANAKARCTRPSHPLFPEYGGRGIQFNFESFESFFTEVGKRPSPQHSIDRIRNDDPVGYAAGNCRWATVTQQLANQRPKRPYRGRTLPRGVYYQDGRYSAAARINRRLIYVGRFDTVAAASAALEAKQPRIRINLLNPLQARLAQAA